MVFADGETLPLDGVFVALGTAGSTDFARKLGAPLDGTHIRANADGSTAVPGLFAAGDCTGGLLQVAKAVYEGAVAGMDASRYTRPEKAPELAAAEGVDISGIQNTYVEAEEALKNGDYARYAGLNRDFHSEIWEAAGNTKMANMIAELWNGLSMGNMVTEEEYAKISIEEHGRIMEAIEQRDGTRARQEMYAHIMRSRDDMLTYYQ